MTDKEKRYWASPERTSVTAEHTISLLFMTMIILRQDTEVLLKHIFLTLRWISCRISLTEPVVYHRRISRIFLGMETESSIFALLIRAMYLQALIQQVGLHLQRLLSDLLFVGLISLSLGLLIL